MNEVNLRGAGQPGDVAAEPSRRHRRSPLRRRSTSCDADGRPASADRDGRHAGRARRLLAPTSAVAAPVFQVAIVDVDTGLVVTTATSQAGDVPGDRRRRRRDRMPVRRSCRCGRGSTCCGCRSPTRISWRRTTSSPPGRDSRSPARAAASTSLRRRRQDGLVSLPFRFEHRAAPEQGPSMSAPRPCSCRSRTARAPATCCGTGLLRRVLDADPIGAGRAAVADGRRIPAFVREFAHPRVTFDDLPAHRPRGPRGAAAGDRCRPAT